MPKQPQTRRLGDLFPHLGLVDNHQALAELAITRIAPVEGATAGDLVFIARENYLPALAQGKPTAVVVSEALWEKARTILSVPLLKSKDAMLAFAKCSAEFSSESAAERGVHPTAQVHASATIAASASVGPFVVIGPAAVVGEGAVLHAGVQVGARSRVGEGCVLFPHVVLYQDVTLGARVRIHANTVIGADGFGYVQERVPGGVRHVKIEHTGGVRIGADTEIGASVTIDRGTLNDTVLGAGCIVDNQVQIGHNCQIEEGVIICGSSGLAGSGRVGKFAVIGGFVGVGKVQVGAGAQIAGFSAVSSNVPAGAIWGGVPAMLKKDYNRIQVLLWRLPELVKEMKERKRS